MFDSTTFQPTVESTLLGALTIIVGLVIYFAPSIVAHIKGHEREASIIFANLVLGWTIIGWIVIWIWTLSTLPPKLDTSQRNRQPTVRTLPGLSPRKTRGAARGKNGKRTESRRGE